MSMVERKRLTLLIILLLWPHLSPAITAVFSLGERQYQLEYDRKGIRWFDKAGADAVRIEPLPCKQMQFNTLLQSIETRFSNRIPQGVWPRIEEARLANGGGRGMILAIDSRYELIDPKTGFGKFLDKLGPTLNYKNYLMDIECSRRKH